MVLRIGASSAPEPLIQTSLAEWDGEVSPDGRWLAYHSNETGRLEVYVRPFPAVNDGRWQISTNGGSRPLWSRDGRELFYLDPATAMMAVPIQTTPAFTAGSPAKLFDGPWFVNGQSGRMYDVSPDGRRFVIIKSAPAEERSAAPVITVVVNWSEELKRLVPR